MRTHRLDLFFAEMPPGALTGPPISQVFVKHPIKEEYPHTEENPDIGPDTIFLTTRQDGEKFMHDAIDKLIAELRELKKETSKRYKKAKT